jgi:actin-like ATPase involved in cell morphogenesis
LVFAGLYSAAISLSVDVKLRHSIKKTAMEQSKFLDTIGTAHMSQEVEKKVLRIAKSNLENIEKQSGVESSLTEDDIKQYLQEVFNEIKETKK